MNKNLVVQKYLVTGSFSHRILKLGISKNHWSKFALMFLQGMQIIQKARLISYRYLIKLKFSVKIKYGVKYNRQLKNLPCFTFLLVQHFTAPH